MKQALRSGPWGTHLLVFAPAEQYVLSKAYLCNVDEGKWSASSGCDASCLRSRVITLCVPSFALNTDFSPCPPSIPSQVQGLFQDSHRLSQAAPRGSSEVPAFRAPRARSVVCAGADEGSGSEPADFHRLLPPVCAKHLPKC